MSLSKNVGNLPDLLFGCESSQTEPQTRPCLSFAQPESQKYMAWMASAEVHALPLLTARSGNCNISD